MSVMVMYDDFFFSRINTIYIRNTRHIPPHRSSDLYKPLFEMRSALFRDSVRFPDIRFIISRIA